MSPLPAPYDATSSHPLLGELEAASTAGPTLTQMEELRLRAENCGSAPGEAARLLKLFGLFELRHRPLFALSTGEARPRAEMRETCTLARRWQGRKLLLVDALLQQLAPEEFLGFCRRASGRVRVGSGSEVQFAGPGRGF